MRKLFLKTFRQHAATWMLVIMGLYLLADAAYAAAPAGTPIGNQASATYSDGSAVTRTVTSNTVVTTVQQVASLSLTGGSAKTVAIGGQVVFAHTLTNSGNGTDTFTLASSTTGSFTYGSVQFFTDANGDGVPDNNVPITTTGEVPAGGTFKFVMVATAPPTAVAGTSDTTTVTATSGFNTGVNATNIDTATVSGQAVMQVTQALDLTSGPSPAGPRTITLTYTNTGNSAASNLVLSDAIPSGMTYVANSGRWSVTGSGTVLTDASNSDNQSGVVYDLGVTTASRVTATIASVPAGVSGTLSFQVNVNSGLPPGANAATALTASFAYNDGAGAVPASNTNTVQYVVAAAAGVTLGSSTVASVGQGGTASFTNLLTNTGNGNDSFDLSIGTSTFPVGTVFQLFQPDGVTPLVDSNGNGTPDTGPLAAGGTYNVIVKALLPSSASPGGPYTVQVVATSKVDTTRTATAIDTLTSVTPATVDLTNTSAGAGAPGVGAGPEASAVTTVTAAPNTTARFTLVIANGSGLADNYDLQGSTDPSFASVGLPSGYVLVFKDSVTGAVITNTGVINAGANRSVFADITVPAGAAAATKDVYFRSVSPSTGAADRLHDAVVVSAQRALSLSPVQSGQIVAGGTIVYSHVVTNIGNVTEGDGGGGSSAVVSVSDATSGFTAVVFWDKNNNGVLDASDPVITNLAALTGGSNGASTAAGLSPGESATLFVKVTAPASAMPGTTDAATLSIALSGTLAGMAAPSPTTISDNTSVIASNVTLAKVQALDANCDGTPETAFSSAALTSGTVPGACLRYQITATNVGSAAISALVISDATPANTSYAAAGPAATTQGTVTAPSPGATGTIQATVGTLAPGQSVVLSFGVRINP